jgi:ATP-dependent Clp protease protease subunit
VYLRARMFEILGRLTKQPLERIEREFDRDRYMSAEEAARYGMIDRVVTSNGGGDAARVTAPSRENLYG